MNSVYKRYLIITLIGLLMMTGLIMNNKLTMLRQVDTICSYVEGNGTADGLWEKYPNIRKHFSCYTVTEDEGEEIMVPYFGNFQTRMCYDDFSGIGAIAIGLLLLFMYLYERQSSTADFCMALPVRARSAYLIKAFCLGLVVLSLCLMQLWAIYAYNVRVPVMNKVGLICEPYKYTSDYAELPYTAVLQELRTYLQFGTILLFLSECTGKVYLPIVICVLATYALFGASRGVMNFTVYYFDFDIDLRKIEVNYEAYFDYFVSAAAFLWGLYLAGVGDMSRKGRVFRFKWVENVALICIVLCGIGCAYEVMALAEFNYALSLVWCLVILAVIGFAVYYIARKMIMWIGR